MMRHFFVQPPTWSIVLVVLAVPDGATPASGAHGVEFDTTPFQVVKHAPIKFSPLSGGCPDDRHRVTQVQGFTEPDHHRSHTRCDGEGDGGCLDGVTDIGDRRGDGHCDRPGPDDRCYCGDVWCDGDADRVACLVATGNRRGD